MNCNLRNFVLAVVFVLTFVHHTYAPWTSKPPQPPPTQRDTCVGWIFFNGFKDNATNNRDEALSRETKYDKDASVWAALYAISLTVFLQYLPPPPDRFCRHRYMTKLNVVEFSSLGKYKTTCIKWITLFGFDTQTPDDMWNLVHGRTREQDKYMSIWPALYARYIQINQDRASTKQEDFCKQMGHTDRLLPYVAMHETRGCRGWLSFAGYSKSLENNMELVLKLNTKYFEVMNEFIVLYSRELLDHIDLNITENPERTRNLMRNPDEMNVRSPEEFCNTFGDYGTQKRPYTEL